MLHVLRKGEGDISLYKENYLLSHCPYHQKPVCSIFSFWHLIRCCIVLLSNWQCNEAENTEHFHLLFPEFCSHSNQPVYSSFKELNVIIFTPPKSVTGFTSENRFFLKIILLMIRSRKLWLLGAERNNVDISKNTEPVELTSLVKEWK